MNNLNPPTSSGRLALVRSLREPLVFGTLCGVFSAVGYTAANICLRVVAHDDPVWVSAVKAFPTVALFGPWLAWRWFRGQERFPTWRLLGVLTVAALVCQLFGNVVFQWALGIVGIALVVPLTLGTMIVSGAVMGRVFLHESVTVRMALSTVVLIGAICVLSLGAGDASRNVVPQGMAITRWLVTLGVAAACLSGIAYALLGVVIRHSVTGRMSVAMSLVTTTLTGVVSLGVLAWWKIGWLGMRSTPASSFWTMMLAGVFNAIAFFALTKALQLIPIVYVNALNASQAAMAAIAGILLFNELPSVALWVGIALTIVGLLMMQRRRLSAKPPGVEISDVAPAGVFSVESPAEPAESTA